MKKLGILFSMLVILNPASVVMAQKIGERTLRDTRIPDRKIPPKYVIQPPLPKQPVKEDKKGPIASSIENKMAEDAGAKEGKAANVTTGSLPIENGEDVMHDHGDGVMHSHKNGNQSHDSSDKKN
jgi:hypothetical protein